MTISHSKLKQHLHYNYKTGVWTRRVDSHTRGGFWAGDRADRKGTRDYRLVTLLGRTYPAHVLAIFYITKQWPKPIADHQDCDPSNNEIGNLRPATHAQNRANSRKPKNNTSGYKGVQKTENGKWKARISVSRKQYCLGVFANPTDAHKAYLLAAVEHFGEFAHGG